MKFYMAPLEEMTGYIYRRAYHEFFCPMDKYFAPFIAAKMNRGKLFNYKEKNDILPEHNEGIYLVPQILTNVSEDFVRTARGLKAYGYKEVNLNLGCPSKPVVNGGRGSGFLEKKEELRRFLDDIFQLDMKISIKTRVGRWESEEIGPLSELFLQYPLEEWILHPRVQTDFYRGSPRLDAFSTAYRKVYPGDEKGRCALGYNGDIFSVEDFERILAEFPQVDSIMLGRGILADPGLMGRIKGKSELDKEKWRAFLERLEEDFCRISVSEEKALFKMKELWCYFRFSFPNMDVWEQGIKRAANMEEYRSAVQRLWEEYPGEPGGAFPCGDRKTRGRFGGF